MRASFPRFRIDQMMAISWKLLTPLAIGTVILTAVIDKLLPGGDYAADRRPAGCQPDPGFHRRHSDQPAKTKTP